MNLLDRLWKRTTKTGACWLWTGATTSNGYGQIYDAGRVVLVHRAVYEAIVGPIPAGLQIDHLCRVRNCVNPSHLEPVTRLENVRRGDAGAWNAAKTHCSNGHEFSSENTYVWHGWRECRACHADRAAVRRMKAKQEAALIQDDDQEEKTFAS